MKFLIYGDNSLYHPTHAICRELESLPNNIMYFISMANDIKSIDSLSDKLNLE